MSEIKRCCYLCEWCFVGNDGTNACTNLKEVGGTTLVYTLSESLSEPNECEGWEPQNHHAKVARQQQLNEKIARNGLSFADSLRRVVEYSRRDLPVPIPVSAEVSEGEIICRKISDQIHFIRNRFNVVPKKVIISARVMSTLSDYLLLRYRYFNIGERHLFLERHFDLKPIIDREDPHALEVVVPVEELMYR